jgi:hypothetical protein
LPEYRALPLTFVHLTIANVVLGAPCRYGKKVMTTSTLRPASWGSLLRLGFRASLLLPVFLSALSGQPLVLEDFTCYQITNAVSSGATTRLSCVTPHGLAVGAQYHVWVQGGTGQWAGLNTQYEGISNGSAVGTTDTVILVNDSTYVNLGLVAMGNQYPPEYINVVSKDQGHLYLGPGTAPGCDSNGRGCNGGSRPLPQSAQCSCFVANLRGPQVWNATAVDANTFEIPLNSSTFGSFSGQTIYLRRALYSVDPASPNVRAYTGQPWSIYDQAGPDGLAVTIPACTNKTDAFECSRGFLTPFNGKGYGFSNTVISSFSVSNSVATIMFASPYVDIPANAILTPIAQAPQGIGGLVYIQNMNEGTVGGGRLNRPYLVNDIIMSGSQKVGIHANISNVPDGTYAGANPVMTMPWPSDGYTDSNWMNGSADSYPASTARSFVKSGKWDPTYNRLRYWVKYDGVSRPISKSDGLNFGTYTFFGDDPSDKAHGYHAADFAINSGQWIKVEMSQKYQGLVGGGSNPDASANPYANSAPSAPPVDAPAWRGGSRNYFDALERWYVDPSSSSPMTQPLSGSTQTFKRFEFDKATREPEDLVAARTIQYDGNEYLLSVAGPKQSSVSGNIPTSYNFYYSTSGDLKSAGLSSAKFAGSASISSDGCCAYFTGPAMPQASSIWWGIRPVAPVYRTSGASVSPIYIWGMEDYGWTAGDHVTTANIAGNTAANVTNATIQAVYPKQSWYRFVPTTGTWNTPSTLTSIVSNGTTCVVSLTANHNLVVDWPIYVSDGVPSGGPNRGFYNVSKIDSPTQFEFSCPGTTVGTYNTDSDGYHHLAVQSLPGFAVSGTGTGAYSGASQGTMVSTDDTKNFAQITFEPLSSSPASLPPSSSACDLNGDGVVNSSDVSLSISMALGQIPCTGGTRGMGTCTVVDTQRVINASTGGGCKTGS